MYSPQTAAQNQQWQQSADNPIFAAILRSAQSTPTGAFGGQPAQPPQQGSPFAHMAPQGLPQLPTGVLGQQSLPQTVSNPITGVPQTGLQQMTAPPAPPAPDWANMPQGYSKYPPALQAALMAQDPSQRPPGALAGGGQGAGTPAGIPYNLQQILAGLSFR